MPGPAPADEEVLRRDRAADVGPALEHEVDRLLRRHVLDDDAEPRVGRQQRLRLERRHQRLRHRAGGEAARLPAHHLRHRRVRRGVGAVLDAGQLGVAGATFGCAAPLDAAAPFVVAATGILSVPLEPAIPGMESFTGTSLHTSRWPESAVDLSGKRVGVIGTVVAAQIKKGEVKERLKCVYCDGGGQIVCGHCLGTGVVSSMDDKGNLVVSKCGNCESTGTVVCINCQGSGLSVPDDFLQVLGDEEVGFTEEDYSTRPRATAPEMHAQRRRPDSVPNSVPDSLT